MTDEAARAARIDRATADLLTTAALAEELIDQARTFAAEGDKPIVAATRALRMARRAAVAAVALIAI